MIFDLQNTSIQSIGLLTPEEFLTSQWIEEQLAPLYQKLKLSLGRLELMSGVQTRGVWPVGTRPSTLATKASLLALEKINLPQKGAPIDLLINASVCRDALEPATAAFVHQQLELSSNCPYFDLGNACLGVLQAIIFAAQWLEAGHGQRALVVAAENSAPLLHQVIKMATSNPDFSKSDLKKAFANLTLGSGAVAVVVSKNSLGLKLGKGLIKSDTSASNLCQGDGDLYQLHMQTDSEQLLKAGMNLVQESWSKACELQIFDPASIDVVVGHQVGSAHEHRLKEILKLPDTTAFARTFHKWGNTGSTAIAMALEDYQRAQGQSLNGKQVALMGIGSGLTSLMIKGQWYV